VGAAPSAVASGWGLGAGRAAAAAARGARTAAVAARARAADGGGASPAVGGAPPLWWSAAGGGGAVGESARRNAVSDGIGSPKPPWTRASLRKEDRTECVMLCPSTV